MSKIVTIVIDNILDGWTATEYLGGDGQFQSAVGLDPELPRSDTGFKPSGILRPTALATFSGANVTGYPVVILTNPKTTDVYVLLSNGRLIKYDKTLVTETLSYDTLGAGDGGWYQNDYLYFPYANDVARFGPLSGSPSMTLGVWTGATLGTQTALQSNTYPSLLTAKYPQHFGFNHSDDKAYFLDFKDGQGMIHFIKTTHDGTNDSSTYNALDLPFGLLPTCGASYGNDVAIGATKITDNSVMQGGSSVFFWDTVDTSFYREVKLPGVLTALFNEGGKIYAWSGSIAGNGKHKLYLYDGALDFVEVKRIPEGFPPHPYAVDSLDGRIIWGSFLTEPIAASVVHAYGGISPRALQTIYKSGLTHTTTDGIITALKWVLQGITGLVTGGQNSNTSQFLLEKVSTTYGTSIFRSKMFNIGQNFTVKEVKLPLGATLAANMTLIPKLYIDDFSKNAVLRTINSTNYTDTNRNRLIKGVPTTDANGQNNFCLELAWSGTALLPVLLPIIISVEVQD